MSVIPRGSGGGTSKQEKTVTAGTTAIAVTPDKGKLLSKVMVNPTPTEEKTVTPSDTTQEVTPTSGKYLSKVIINAVPKQLALLMRVRILMRIIARLERCCATL